MASINIQEEINKEMNLLDNYEDDIEKIGKATHKIILLMSMKTALNQMAEKEENHELEEENEKNIELFHQLIQKNYGNILEFVKKELDN